MKGSIYPQKFAFGAPSPAQPGVTLLAAPLGKCQLVLAAQFLDAPLKILRKLAIEQSPKQPVDCSLVQRPITSQNSSAIS